MYCTDCTTDMVTALHCRQDGSDGDGEDAATVLQTQRRAHVVMNLGFIAIYYDVRVCSRDPGFRNASLLRLLLSLVRIVQTQPEVCQRSGPPTPNSYCLAFVYSDPSRRPAPVAAHRNDTEQTREFLVSVDTVTNLLCGCY